MYFNDNYGKFINFELSSTEFIKQLQSYSDTLIKEFKDEKTAEDWIFEDGKDGIPPEQ